MKDVLAETRKESEGSEKLKTNLGKIKISNNALWKLTGDDEVKFIELAGDDRGYEILGKFLGIPTPYLLRLPKNVKASNIEYWLGFWSEKEVDIIYKDMELIEIKDGTKIEMIDVLNIVDKIFPDSKIYQIKKGANSTCLDIYREDVVFNTDQDTYFGGLRVNVKNSLNAPDIAPIFINVNSCGIIECSSFLEKLIIKNLSYKDILRAIEEKITNCAESLEGIFNTFEEISNEKINNPSRRIALYCREHNVSDRISEYALSKFGEAHLQEADFEDLICLFSVLSFKDEVKNSSAQKLQRLAGHIVMRAMKENRCKACDATLIEE